MLLEWVIGCITLIDDDESYFDESYFDDFINDGYNIISFDDGCLTKLISSIYKNNLNEQVRCIYASNAVNENYWLGSGFGLSPKALPMLYYYEV